MEQIKETLKYIKLYTGCDDHALKRITPILEKLYEQREKTIVVKEKQVVEVVHNRTIPNKPLEVWVEKYCKENNTSIEKINKRSNETEVCRIRALFCIEAYKEGYGYSEIARYLKRNHTTIMYYIKNIKIN